MSRFHKLKVKSVERLTPEAVAIEFNIPEDLKQKFHFKAGQYLTIKHEHEGEEIRRDYSICTSPNHPTIKVGVKEVKNGKFSRFANQHIEVDTELEVMEPQGRFTFTHNVNRDSTYVAIAAGSGITPIFSIINLALEEELNSKFLLIYGNRSLKQTMFLDQIDSLKKKYPNRFFVEMVYSQEHVEEAKFGRIDRSIINFFLKNRYKEWSIEHYFLCGPGDLIEQVKTVLIDNEVDESKIKFELFTSSQVEKDIQTDGMTQITVILDDEETSFEMDQENLILDVALDEGLDAPYSCRGGICSTCMALIKEGEAKMRKNQILTDDEVANGYILTCQAQPITPRVVVDYDDV